MQKSPRRPPEKTTAKRRPTIPLDQTQRLNAEQSVKHMHTVHHPACQNYPVLTLNLQETPTVTVTGSPAGNRQLGQHRAHMPSKMGTLQQGLHARRPRTQRPVGNE